MRIGFWRGLSLAVALASTLATSRTASADGFHKTIPREVLAQDVRTGGPYYAPPIPYGHYAKDGFMSCLHGGYFGKAGHGCGILGCGLGHGGGGLGHGGGGCGLLGCGGLFHKGDKGCGDGGCGLGHGGGGCGLFKGHGGGGCDDGGCGLGHAKRFKNCGLCKGKGCGVCETSGPGVPIHTLASAQSPTKVIPAPVASSPQGYMPSGPCTEPGCTFGHGGGDPCGSCGGKGCGLCGLFKKGHGGGFGHGGGDPCRACGGKGCGLCGLFNKGGCGACGGRGCGLCSKLKGLALGGLFHHKNKIKYFVGAGGPIPLTPGYTPYVVTTRSPRDFFSFPPYTPDTP
ncbi:hypothetical protein TA3x_005281 [Tundrisphaera sp. TA3]|uniref:hypothetical protein n=1 Tax=Tundrisphaera sp. TA3 TaxID=3435775 RepID=UPI003EB7D749